MPLCNDCRNEAMIVGGQDDVYSGELSRPCSRCGWFPLADVLGVWDMTFRASVEWSDEQIQEFMDEFHF